MSGTFPLIEVSGTAFEMGYQHGRQARHLIRQYLAWIDRSTGQPRGVLCGHALRFMPGIQKLSRPFMEEVLGLAEGAGIPFAEALLCQCRSEAAHQWEGACTAFALRGEATVDGVTLAGQNQDLEPQYADVAIILKVNPSDGRPRAVMMTFAGQLGYAGMNQFGVANFTNALYNFRWRPALPFYPLRRLMLERRNVPQCVDLLRQNRTCSAANFVLCDGQGNIGDVEVRPEGIAILEGPDPDARLHTNHYVTKAFDSCEDSTLPDSQPRLARFSELIHRHWGNITVDTLKILLADHDGDPGAICRHGAQSLESVSGYIAEPAKSLLHVRRGHGCDGVWMAYRV